MSKIEKALKKSIKEIKENEGSAYTHERTDTDQSDVHDKDETVHSTSQKMTEPDNDVSMLNYLKIHDYESSSESKTDKSGSHIISAIEKQENENSAAHSPLISGDYGQLMEGSGLLPQERDKENTGSLIPATTINNYEVDEHIASYYETVGKQTWKGPIMVHFRRLQVSLSGLQSNNMCKVMVFTSSNQKEGKSTISTNMAITLCSNKRTKVAIVDCDFRKPTLNKLLGFSPKKGLSDYLLEEADIKDILINGLVQNLTMVPVGNKPSNTCELFASERMRQVITYLREHFDYVIIDTPPVLAFPDTVIIAPLSDGVVFVLNCKKTRKSIAKRAIETLSNCKILGFVMNMSEAAAVDYYGYTSGYYYYDYASS